MQNTQPAGRPHRNHGLFSDHYLNLTLPARPDWKALADEARPALEEIAGLLDSYTPSEDEDSAKGRAVASTTHSGRHVGLTNSAFSKKFAFAGRKGLLAY